ncbi:unnamed protein product [Pleuronectes platessa]|uniref:Uncharacterized protein n=1 Tax=Pleuronectes platessa TaxID=8262 RepID=A0A9N7VAK0_PLEPL|nr:unnamed protein product [Pleuronectes platessa]
MSNQSQKSQRLAAPTGKPVLEETERGEQIQRSRADVWSKLGGGVGPLPLPLTSSETHPNLLILLAPPPERSLSPELFCADTSWLG